MVPSTWTSAACGSPNGSCGSTPPPPPNGTRPPPRSPPCSPRPRSAAIGTCAGWYRACTATTVAVAALELPRTNRAGSICPEARPIRCRRWRILCANRSHRAALGYMHPGQVDRRWRRLILSTMVRLVAAAAADERGHRLEMTSWTASRSALALPLIHSTIASSCYRQRGDCRTRRRSDSDDADLHDSHRPIAEPAEAGPLESFQCGFDPAPEHRETRWTWPVEHVLTGVENWVNSGESSTDRRIDRNRSADNGRSGCRLRPTVRTVMAEATRASICAARLIRVTPSGSVRSQRQRGR